MGGGSKCFAQDRFYSAPQGWQNMPGRLKVRRLCTRSVVAGPFYSIKKYDSIIHIRLPTPSVASLVDNATRCLNHFYDLKAAHFYGDV